MRPSRRPHVLGIDDGPVDRFAADGRASIVGVMMEGPDLVEAVAVTSHGVDREGVTGFLGDWILGLRATPALQCVMFSGITIAGLCVIDVEGLASRIDLPVVIVNRRNPACSALRDALRSAGLSDRIAQVDRTPPARRLESGIYAAVAGTGRAHAEQLIHATRAKADLPEPLRLAHLIARAVTTGESRGRA